ncbi:putative DNA-binding domain-containing protein [Iodobacter arcticus]|uniref:DNA-binding domain-containing protein n=1 Tax=Iodobacter arcticus TaxID=590593 RepID=A0ABW2QYU2_9NEIS
MNYANALKDFSQIFKKPHHQPKYIQTGSLPFLDIYRNNVLANRSANLANTYPTVMQLVGEEFFSAMARVFVENSESHSGNLHHDGESFPDFLNTFPHVSDLPYLSDMAKLDWAIHLAHYSADCNSIAIETLASYTPEQFGKLSLILHPAVAIVKSSAWPIYQILMMHHGASPADLNAGGEQVWVWRDHWQLLSISDALFLESLLNSQNIESAMRATADDEYDAGPVLIQLFSRGLVCQIN